MSVSTFKNLKWEGMTQLDLYPPESHEWHFWIAWTGPVLCKKANPSKNVLPCSGPHGSPPNMLHISIEKSAVTCQDCLEWLHS